MFDALIYVLFLMLLKFGAVLSIICGFLMAIYTHSLQYIVVVRSFLRMLKLRKLAVHKLYLSRGWSYSVSRCVRTRIKLVPKYPFNHISHTSLEGCAI